MQSKTLDTEELAIYFSKYIESHISQKILEEATYLNIDLEHILEECLAKQINETEVVQKITNACELKRQIIYNNLIDNYQIIPVGIRDCYKKSM
ncbi:hypothetical protein [uncultured Endozoicomonas sp.]|uniref:hypothetical protein n=1 Tax=uncultured Endozoicomonas sp. TaxID=432652 RepID=UPI00262BE12F|nr:hypothetical protein [uncultured Endozoicomonas sp.]